MDTLNRFVFATREPRPTGDTWMVSYDDLFVTRSFGLWAEGLGHILILSNPPRIVGVWAIHRKWFGEVG